MVDIELNNLARSVQKFINKKKSVGYSHPPIHEDGKAHFSVSLEKGVTYRVVIEPWEIMDELVAKGTQST